MRRHLPTRKWLALGSVVLLVAMGARIRPAGHRIVDGPRDGGPHVPVESRWEGVGFQGVQPDPDQTGQAIQHREVLDDPWAPRQEPPPPGIVLRSTPVVRGPYKSVQVNVDAAGVNIPGDAANEPSIAIDPTDPSKIVIGWRQFDSVTSNFRQAGWGYSHDGGQTWTFPGVIEPGVFRSDPVLAADADGNIYYYSFPAWPALFKSIDGGLSWDDGIDAPIGDKSWMAIDRTDGIGRNNIYVTHWGYVSRSTDGAATWEPIPGLGSAVHGTVAVGPDGELYRVSKRGSVSTSSNACDPAASPVFEFATDVDLGGDLAWTRGAPNPVGLIGQAWIATDRSDGPTRGNVYVLGTVKPQGWDSASDIKFARSTDGGLTWSEAIRINDDCECSRAWHWFGTLSVAPNGRIDVVWNDTRASASPRFSELYYAFSSDGGVTWSENIAVSPVFDSWAGWPNQNKIGDYYDMISDDAAVNIAYAATFNGEQDVYFLRAGDCNQNGVHDGTDVADGTSGDCNGNDIPDECEDCNGNGVADECDVIEGGSEDCNHNAVPDECEPNEDCNGNGMQDACDIAARTSHDWNLNEIPDECEPHEIIYVDASNLPGPGSGTEADPFCRIQDGIDAAPDPATGIVEVRVADGTYTGEGNKNLSFGGKSIVLRSANGAEDCIINCEGAGRGFHFFLSGETPASRVEGFTIVNGSAYYGGGLECYFSSPTIVDCTIASNSAESGGGIFAGGLEEGPTLIGCTIAANTADVRGGGMYTTGVRVKLIDCNFIGNTASRGGGMCNWWGVRAELTHCVFADNRAEWRGGAVFNDSDYASSSPHTRAANCVFVGNDATDWGGATSSMRGNSRMALINCFLVGNQAGGEGGAMAAGNACLLGCTLSGNRAANNGGAMYGYRGLVGMLDCTLWGDAALSQGRELYMHMSYLTVSYSNVEGGQAGIHMTYGTPVWGDGNLDEDPIFVGGSAGVWTADATYDPSTFRTTFVDDTAAWNDDEMAGKFLNPDSSQYLQSLVVGNTATALTVWGDFASLGATGAAYQLNDYHLTKDSPCIGAGDPGFSLEPWATDIDREPRVFDGRVDMGADEYWDCNGNETPDYQELAVGSSEDQNGNGILDECEVITTPLDIKPGGCPNPLNRSSQGVLPVAVVGTAQFDVTMIDVASVRLSRADGVGGVIAPHEGPPGPHSVFEDVATPFGGVPCDCHGLPGDGLDDLSMKFSTQDVVAALELGGQTGGDAVELVLTGTLLDGTSFTTASDCVVIVPVGNTAVRARPNAPGSALRERPQITRRSRP